MDFITSEKEAIDHIFSIVKRNIENKVQLALQWAKQYKISITEREYDSRQISALVFLYESTQPFTCWKIGETLCNMDTAENNYLVSWLTENFYFEKEDIYEAFFTWMNSGARLGHYIAYGMNNTYEIMQEAAFKGDDELLKWLLSRNIEIDFRDNAGRTALHMAASQGHLATVNFLLERGASRFVLDSKRRSPFVSALEREHFQICDILSPMVFENMMIESITLNVLQDGNIRKLQYLLRNNKENFIWNALVVAVENGYPLIVDMLLYHCPSFVHAPNEYNKTVLTKAFVKGDMNIIEKLLAAGLELDESLVNIAKENKIDGLLNWLNPTIDTVD